MPITTTTVSSSSQDLGNVLHSFDMGPLKTHLPKKRKGLSKHFSGQTKSFTCLADAKCIEDLKKKREISARKRGKYLDRQAAAFHPLLSCGTEMSNSSCHKPCVGL